MVFHCMDILRFVCSSVDGPLGGFCLLAPMNKAAVTFVYKFLCGCKFLALLGAYLGVKLLGHRVTLGLTV